MTGENATRPTPGTRIRVNDRSVWPERIGCAGVVVGPDAGILPSILDAFPRELPGHEVAVLLDDDPLAGQTGEFARSWHEDTWSCVMGLDALDTEPAP